MRLLEGRREIRMIWESLTVVDVSWFLKDWYNFYQVAEGRRVFWTVNNLEQRLGNKNCNVCFGNRNQRSYVLLGALSLWSLWRLWVQRPFWHPGSWCEPFQWGPPLISCPSFVFLFSGILSHHVWHWLMGGYQTMLEKATPLGWLVPRTLSASPRGLKPQGPHLEDKMGFVWPEQCL